jgi:hypothetical protein
MLKLAHCYLYRQGESDIQIGMKEERVITLLFCHFKESGEIGIKHAGKG